MADLLTTGQVQELLQVDRTTIYRMIEDGRLPAIRVGKQWRFRKDELQHWLQAQGTPQTIEAGRSAAVAAAEAPVPAAPLAQILPLGCAQLIQDAFAEMLGCMLLITDMQGQPLTQPSNPSGLFVAATERTSGGWAACVRSWGQLASDLSLEPKFATSALGLLCARGVIRRGAELQGLVVAGCIAPEDWPPSSEQIAAAAQELGADPAALRANCGAVYRLDSAERARVLRFLQRIADVFAHMAEDRSLIYDRLQTIAKLTSL
jgi:excisionase family DNA binding protein